MKLRHEFKHIINYGDYLLLKSRLEKILERDANADAHGEYRVRSLYFDDPFDAALKDKINGVERREKFRLRCYNEDFTAIRLEKKTKLSGMGQKKSVRLSREETEAILLGRIDFLLFRKDDLLIEFYSKYKGRLLRPKTIVEYIREPFVYTPGNVRITLDRDIRTGLYSRNFFEENPLYMPSGDAFAVLEIKYDNFLPEFVAKAVQIGDRRAAAFSKYAMSRKYD
ncbi:MAG: polyphosphate polymerase domain-containing protein [Christensenellales bacterium]|jgi:hypothetical protein